MQIGLDAERDRVKDAGVTVTTTTLSGRAAPEIVAHAKKTGVDLIVMGTHGRSGFQHALLGSVAERVVHHSPCPVLVVPMREQPRRHSVAQPASAQLDYASSITVTPSPPWPFSPGAQRRT